MLSSLVLLRRERLRRMKGSPKRGVWSQRQYMIRPRKRMKGIHSAQWGRSGGYITSLSTPAPQAIVRSSLSQLSDEGFLSIIVQDGIAGGKCWRLQSSTSLELTSIRRPIWIHFIKTFLSQPTGPSFVRSRTSLGLSIAQL